MDSFSDVATYSYNNSGVRTKKTINNVGCNNNTEKEYLSCDESSSSYSIDFYLSGNKILKQHDCCNDLTFFYGVDGLTGFHMVSENVCYNGELLDHNFFYKKNIQNDIVGIYDENGELIIEYVYDAWGNQTAYNAKTGEVLDILNPENYTNISNPIQFIAMKNPFRYRSYYYDFETGLYYLNSRYYDPQTGRFINADDISYITPDNINGLNLFAYCLNNPIALTDSNGNSWLSDIWNFFKRAWEVIVGTILSVVLVATGVFLTLSSGGTLFKLGTMMIGAGIGGLIGGIQSESNGGSFWGGYLGGFITGAVTAFGASFSPLGAFSGAFIGNIAGSVITDSINGKNIGGIDYWGGLFADSTLAAMLAIVFFHFGESSLVLKELGWKTLFATISILAEFTSSHLYEKVKEFLRAIADNLRGFLFKQN